MKLKIQMIQVLLKACQNEAVKPCGAKTWMNFLRPMKFMLRESELASVKPISRV